MPPTRSAREVIDEAIRENRRWESTCLAFLVAFAAAGLGVFLWGAFRGDGVMALAGTLAGGLLWPALREAKSIRADNVRIRLYELALNRARTANEVAEILGNALDPSERN